MSEKMMSFELNEDMVKPILEKQIQTAILANIGKPEELIGKIVSIALKEKVSDNGKKSEYSSYNKYDYLEIITNNAIREAAKNALAQWLEENSQILKAKIIEELNKPQRRDSIVKAFADAAESSFKADWNFKCDFKFWESK